MSIPIAGQRFRHIITGCVQTLDRRNSRLGWARDQDVLLQYSRRRRYRRWAQSSRRSVKRARDKSYPKLAADLCSDDYRTLLRDIDRLIRQHERPIGGELRSADVTLFAETRLSEWQSEIEKLGRRLKKLGRKQQHRLRLKCKHYRYIIDCLLEFGATLPFQELLFRDVAKQVHAMLGDLRDLKRLKDTGHGRPPGYRAKEKKLLQAEKTAFRSQR